MNPSQAQHLYIYDNRLLLLVMKSLVIFFLLLSTMLFNGCEQSIYLTEDTLNPIIHKELLQKNWRTLIVLFGIIEEFDMESDQSIKVITKNGSSSTVHVGTWTVNEETETYTCIFNHNNPTWAKEFIFTPISTNYLSNNTYEVIIKYSIFYIDNDVPETGETVLYFR